MASGWGEVSSVIRAAKAGMKTEAAIEEAGMRPEARPRVAVVVGAAASGGGGGAVRVDASLGRVQVPDGPKAGFRFDSVEQAADMSRTFGQHVEPMVDGFIGEQRSGAVVLVGSATAQLRHLLGGAAGGLLQAVLARLAAEAGATWDIIVTVVLPEAAGTMVTDHGHSGHPVGSPMASPRMRPIAVRLEGPRDVATVCGVIDRQLAQIWETAEIAMGGQMICTIQRRTGAVRPSPSPSRRAAPLIARKQVSMDGGAQLSIVAFGTVQAPNHITFRTMTRLLKLKSDHTQAPKTKEAEKRAYALAGNTVHVRGIPMDFSEAALRERFREYGYVLTAVIRIRAPDAEHPHNSWALVAFAEVDSVERLMGADNMAHVQGEGMVFTARLIDPKLAMTSDGSFAHVFRMCRARVDQARAIALACADSKVTYHLRDSLGPGSSFLLLAAVDEQASAAEYTLATLKAVSETGMVEGANPKMKQKDQTSHLLKMCTIRIRRHLMQHSFAKWNTEMMDHRTGQQVIKRIARVQMNRMRQRSFTLWSEHIILARRIARFLVTWRRRYCRGRFDRWKNSVALAKKQRLTIRRVHSVMVHKQVHAAFTRWHHFSTERKWAAQVCSQVLRRLLSQLMAKAFSSWVAWLRAMQKAVMSTKAVLMRILQRALSAAFNAWSAAHKSRQRRSKIMSVCVLRLQRLSTVRAFQRWRDHVKGTQRSRRIVEQVLYRLRSLATARAFSAWARVAAAKKEHLIKTTVERMMRMGASNSVRYSWNQWCRHVRFALREATKRAQESLAAYKQRAQVVQVEDTSRVKEVLLTQRRRAAAVCLRCVRRRRATRCFDCWARWCTQSRRQAAAKAAAKRCQDVEKRCEATVHTKEYDAATMQHEVSAMLALHQHTCQARTDAKQMSERAAGHQVEFDLTTERRRYDQEIEALTATNQRLRNAVINTLSECAELRERHSQDRATNMQLRENLLATQARLSDVLAPVSRG